MTSKAQWTVIVIVATLGAFFLVSLGGLAGWALFRPAGYGWDWPLHMGSWMGTGMMGGWSGSSGMMGLSRGTCGFQGGSLGGSEGALSLSQSAEAVEEYLASLNLPDLAVAEVMEFSNHFYAEVEEESTGVHAMELLVDKDTGAVFPEYGPNMMWNTKYGMHAGSGWSGMMGGMMGGYGTLDPDADMSVSADQALQYAQQYLDARAPGNEVANEADSFYGYYTIHVLRDGQIQGMLSVNGYNGQVWYHSWHGDFVDMWEMHES
ncbi:MAG: hypothetical protein GTO63_19980 [Anaerolineae bacterium]|nr:hypothetical protein [Anaerolineae bacterium]NIN97059.1 hypothetical protein [Anaerolineae bacterium]NIQ80008.1 hypothetical protein [Anaerolineae bacterium]